MRGSILESDVPPRQDVALSDKQSDMHRKQNTPNNEFRQESHSQHLPGSSQNFSHQQNRQVSNNVNLGERPYLRARRRVRQRVDAGEPRNSYSSIPGFSFRSSGSSVTSNAMMNASGNNLVNNNSNFFAAAAAARMAATQNHRNSDFPDLSNQNQIHPYPNSAHPQGAAMAQQMHHIQQMMMKNNSSNVNAFNRPPHPPNTFIGSSETGLHPTNNGMPPFPLQASQRFPTNAAPPTPYQGSRFHGPHHLPVFRPQYPPRFHHARFLNQPQHQQSFPSNNPCNKYLGENNFQNDEASMDASINNNKVGNNCPDENFPRTGSIIGDIRAGMAAAAFSAATAVQRAQMMLQHKQKIRPEDDLNKSPPTEAIEAHNVVTSKNMESLSDILAKDSPECSQSRENLDMIAQENELIGDLIGENDYQKDFTDFNKFKSHEIQHNLENGFKINESLNNINGPFEEQSAVGEKNDSASCEAIQSDQPIIEVEEGHKEKCDKNVERVIATSIFSEYGNLAEEKEVGMLDKQTLASKKMEECSSSKNLDCANEKEKEGTNNGDLRGEEPEKEGNLVLEEQGLQPRLTRSNLRNQRRAINRTSSSNLVQVNSSGSIDDEPASVTEVQGIGVEEVRVLNKEGVELGGEMDVRHKEGEKEIKEMTQHKVIQEGALSNVFENDAVQKDFADKLDVDDEEDENDDGRGEIRKQLHQEGEKEGCFTDIHKGSTSKTEKQQLQNTKIDCLSDDTTSISQHSQAVLHTSSTLLTSASSTSGCYSTSDLNATRTNSFPSIQSLGGITSNSLDARGDISTQINEDNSKNSTYSPDLISSSTTIPNIQKENNLSVCKNNNSSDNNKDFDASVSCANVNDRDCTISSGQNTIITSSHSVLPDTTTNILADNNSNNTPKHTKEYQHWNNSYNFSAKQGGQFTSPSTTNNNFLREFLHGKLALAAAVAQRQQLHHSEYQQRVQRHFLGNHTQYRGTFPPHLRPPAPNFLPPQSIPISPQGLPYPYPPANQFGAIHPLHVNRFLQHSSTLRNNLSRMMEPALLSSGAVGPRDFSATRHNNNDLKDTATVANLMNFIKMRQDALSSAANGSNISDESPRSEENEDSNKLTDGEDEPMDLQRNATDGRSSVQSSDGELLGRASPRSPSSDAGMSSSSGKDPTKSSRLEQIVSSMRNSSPLPGSNSSQNGSVVNGCKKRKLYQPVQHEKSPSSSSDKICSSPYNEHNDDNADIVDDDIIEEQLDVDNEDHQQPENKKKRSFSRQNDENADPSTEHNRGGNMEESNTNCQMPPVRQRAKQVRDSTKVLNKDRITPLPSVIPPLPSQTTQLPLPHGGHMPMNPLQLHMEMAKHFKQIQEQQDKLTKEAITKEIINETINKNNLIDGKLAAQIAAANCPEMNELAGVLKTEITASLDAVMTPIIESIVGRFLQARRTPLGSRPFALDDSSAAISSARNAILGNTIMSNSPTIPHLPPPPTLKQHQNKQVSSGRAPQVRDRAGPRINSSSSLAMENHLTAISQSISQSLFSPSVSNSSSSGSHILPLPPSLRPAPTMSVNSDKTPSIQDDDSDSGAMPEQDEALSLVVTPKKKRHKVTDTRITPRTMSRVLGNESNIMSDLHKQLNNANLPFPPPLSGMKTPSSDASTMNELSPRLPLGSTATGAASHRPQILPGFPGVPGFIPPLPTSVAIPNPSLADFNPFSSFYSPPLPKGLGSDASRVGDDLGFGRSRTPGSPSRDHRDHRERRRSAGLDRDSPASLLPRPSLLNSPDFTSFSKNGDSEKGSSNDQEEFDRVQSSLQQFSGSSLYDYQSSELSPIHLRKAKLMFLWTRYPDSKVIEYNFPDIRFDKKTKAQVVKWFSNFSSTLTPMHLRKAKLMFFWTRYPSSAILKMYFPDIKFNKNNTAQLVKWFSNFREFFYIQMEKYARQALQEGVKDEQELLVNEDHELYRVLNVHYNRNNHIEVPNHFLPVVQTTLQEFFASIRDEKDKESSWKKQIYKIIARYDEPIPDYFKTAEFLKRLE